MTQPHHSVKEQMPNRAQLRRDLLQIRKETPLALRQQWDRSIAEQVITLIQQNMPQHLAVYWPIQAEPDLLQCYQELQQLGVKLALPIVIGKAQALKFVEWCPGDAMDTDSFGIPIPRNREHGIAPDMLLIPCVGFSSQNFRLGYGGGFYDRSLAQLPQAKSVGIAYQLAHTEFTPELYDIPLTHIITELQLSI
jgi:5,10-methenyltetrahydrofolate synthetase